MLAWRHCWAVQTASPHQGLDHDAPPPACCPAETLLNSVTVMQQDFPQRKQQYDAELGQLDQQIQGLNNLLGR